MRSAAMVPPKPHGDWLSARLVVFVCTDGHSLNWANRQRHHRRYGYATPSRIRLTGRRECSVDAPADDIAGAGLLHDEPLLDPVGLLPDPGRHGDRVADDHVVG